MRKMNRRQALFTAAATIGGAALLSGAPTAAFAKGNEVTGAPFDAELVLTINVELGETEDMGEGPDGHRINYPITGGTFTGKGLKGVVIPGGADMSVRRNDGTTLVDALYRLRTDDNQVINIHNYGVWRPNEVGLEKIKRKEKLLEQDYYCYTIPSFQTPPGEYEWMTRNVYVGTIDDNGEFGVIIKVYKINQRK